MTKRTTYEHRITMIVPVAKAAAVATWINANIAADTVPEDLGPGLSPDGTAPSHRWCSVAVRDEQARLILNRLCDLASVSKPTKAQWTNRTRAQKRTWLRGVQDAVKDGFGAIVTLADNEGEWDRPDALLAASGLTYAERPMGAIGEGWMSAKDAEDLRTRAILGEQS